MCNRHSCNRLANIRKVKLSGVSGGGGEVSFWGRESNKEVNTTALAHYQIAYKAS